MDRIKRMFEPESVALIGATDRAGSIGRQIMANLLSGKGGRVVYPVNPTKRKVMGLKCFSSISEVPVSVDLAVIATPAKTVPGIVEECAKKGVGGIVIISAGFGEVGGRGNVLEKELRRIQKKYGVRILGPNCLGFIRPKVGLNATFLRNAPEPGEVAFISQSGALGTAILDWAVDTHVGFSMFASLGSMVDIDFGELIDYLGDDSGTRSIILYMEGVASAKKFISAARGFARSKPIIVLKPGRYSAGAKAALSHTGALAGNYEVYNSVFKRVGVVRVDQIEDLFNCASVLDSKHLPAGSRIAIVSNAGGPGVIAADSVIANGGALADLSKESLEILDKALPACWSRGNPIDILGDADIGRYTKTIRACLDDLKVDGVIVLYTPQGNADPTELAERVVEVSRGSWKPVLTVWMGGECVGKARRIFYENDLPTYSTPEDAIRTYMYMYEYKRNLELLYETPESLPVDLYPPKSHLKLMLRKALDKGRKVLLQDEVDEFLDAYGIPRAEGYVAKNLNSVLSAASRVGYPVVLKAVSSELVHKVDFGGVILGVDSEESLKKNYRLLLKSVRKSAPWVRSLNVYVQKMKKSDYELIIGSRRDNVFGTVILFGRGGTDVEFFKDFSVALPPLNQTLAKRMMEETKIFSALSKGLRNRPPIKMRELEEVVVKFSSMVVDFPEISAVEINPLAASRDGICALDTRIILDPRAVKDKTPYSHLSILPYPAKYITSWKMKGGKEVILRPIRPEDEKMEDELIRGLSDESSRFRFFRIIKELSHKDLVRFCNIDYDREMAIIAETSEGKEKKEIGVGRLIIEPSRNRGEFAIVIADRYQNKGLGTKIIDMLIGVAEEKGLELIYGKIHPENYRMIQICEKMGFEIERDEEEVRVSLKLN